MALLPILLSVVTDKTSLYEHYTAFSIIGAVTHMNFLPFHSGWSPSYTSLLRLIYLISTKQGY